MPAGSALDYNTMLYGIIIIMMLIDIRYEILYVEKRKGSVLCPVIIVITP
jgi:hypothetical protein